VRVGESPSGKASVFGADIRWFESTLPSHIIVKHTERIAPAAAVLSALSTVLCCLPLGFAGAAVAATAGGFVASLRPWLMGAAVIFLAIGFVQLSRARACNRRSRTSVVLLLACSAIVVVTLLFPQLLASVLAR
jgi:glycerol-3-phosphate acyltransferase PlsY